MEKLTYKLPKLSIYTHSISGNYVPCASFGEWSNIFGDDHNKYIWITRDWVIANVFLVFPFHLNFNHKETRNRRVKLFIQQMFLESLWKN